VSPIYHIATSVLVITAVIDVTAVNSKTENHGLGSVNLLGIIRGTGMPRERFQSPQIRQSKNSAYFVRPWVDVVTPERS
jgi:hypothetical protein